MSFALGDRSRLAGCRVSGFETVGSTNALALDAAQAGDPGRHWFAALEQTAGRGRRGRNWQSQKGNLSASLLLVFDSIGDYSGLGFVAGVALAEAVRSLAPDAPVGLKWPNDMMLDGMKASGILLEAVAQTSGKQAIAIGIGVNVVAAPTDLPYPATSLAELGIAAGAEDLFAALTDRFADNFVLWQNGSGLAAILDKWRGFAVGMNAPVSVMTPNGPVSGVFAALDDTGRMVIRGEDGAISTISAGDVHFGSVASIRAD